MRLPTRSLMYVGVGLVAVAFAVIGFVWGKVAGLTAVPLQLPYFISGGLTALALVLIGITLINIQTKLTDAVRRDRQLQQLSELLDEIRVLIGGEEQAAPGWPGASEEVPADDTTEIAPVEREAASG